MSKATNVFGLPGSGDMQVVTWGPTPIGSGVLTTSCQSSSTRSGTGAAESEVWGACPSAVATQMVRTGEESENAHRETRISVAPRSAGVRRLRAGRDVVKPAAPP